MVFVCACSIGKKVSKLQLSDNKDLCWHSYMKLPLLASLQVFFAVLDIIFSAPLSNKMYVVESVSSCTWTCIL